MAEQRKRDDDPVLVTGAAGFIGYHMAAALLAAGRAVVGLDNLSPYYDVRLKEMRLARLMAQPRFRFVRLDLADRDGMAALFADLRPRQVVHLAAQAGVRHSLKDPAAYVDANLVGFANVLEGCRHAGTRHLLYASSSSVYGANRTLPFSVHHPVDHPISLYAATKKANELMAHSYCHLYGLPATGLRFFTVYGPWGRPDMALFLFTRAILRDEPIEVFNNGHMRRDFTYIDDVVEAMLRILERPPAADAARAGEAERDPGVSAAPWRVYNIGNSSPVELTRMIEILEDALGRKARKVLLPMQPGDVPETYADVADLARDAGFSPSTPIEVGVQRFVAWYREHYEALAVNDA